MSFPGFSIVVEWDNTRLGGVAQTRSMLERLAPEVNNVTRAQPSLDPRAEVLMVYDRREVDDALVARLTDEFRRDVGGHVDVHIVPTTGLDYYQLKNVGARRARGEVVVFIDSDVVPAAGWLGQLVQPFGDPTVEVVSGNSSVIPDSLYGKTFALTWFFPLATRDGPLEPARYFFANNVAFRRALLEQHPFPNDPALFRGQCAALADTLHAQGTRIVLNPCARVGHRPPNGFRHFVRRALCHGHDTLIIVTRDDPGAARLRRSLDRFRDNVKDAFDRIRRDHRAVGLPSSQLPYALAIAVSYYALYFVGEVITRFRPGLVRRRFSI
ncbi:MAG TPA: glycosyltransferase [Methylomirabilota bacterium]